jgi:hypothetical protein
MKRSLNSTILILSLVIGLQSYSCKNESTSVSSCNCVSTNGKTCVIYEETYCADPWGQGFVNDNDLKNEINLFLISLTIDLDEIGIEVTSSPESCNACSCKSGRTICGIVDNEDLQLIKELGFTER